MSPLFAGRHASLTNDGLRTTSRLRLTHAGVHMLDGSQRDRENSFAPRLFGALLRKGAENPVLGTISVEQALALAGGAAAGETRAEIGRALGVTGDPLEFLARRSKALSDLGQDAMALANALWFKPGLSVRPAGLARMKAEAGAVVLPFPEEGAEAAINGWVCRNTRGHVKSLVDQRTIEISDFLLLNAMAFDGRWEEPFERQSSRRGRFRTEHGKTVQVAFMQQEMTASYTENEKAASLTLPLAGGDAVIDFLLPHKILSRDDLAALVENDRWAAEWPDAGGHDVVFVSLPRLELTCRSELGSILKASGVTQMFEPRLADFTPLFDTRPMFLEQVVHAASLRLYEEGVSAGAATCVGFLGCEPEAVPVFLADRPFVIRIRDRRHGISLCFAYVTEPPSTSRRASGDRATASARKSD